MVPERIKLVPEGIKMVPRDQNGTRGVNMVPDGNENGT